MDDRLGGWIRMGEECGRLLHLIEQAGDLDELLVAADIREKDGGEIAGLTVGEPDLRARVHPDH